MARCFQQPVHNGLSEAFRGKSLGIDLCHTFIIEFSQNSVQMSGDTVLILTAADTFHHICYITGQQSAQRIPFTLLAEMLIPIPVVQITMPFSQVPSATALAAACPNTG